MSLNTIMTTYNNNYRDRDNCRVYYMTSKNITELLQLSLTFKHL